MPMIIMILLHVWSSQHCHNLIKPTRFHSVSTLQSLKTIIITSLVLFLLLAMHLVDPNQALSSSSALLEPSVKVTTTTRRHTTTKTMATSAPKLSDAKLSKPMNDLVTSAKDLFQSIFGSANDIFVAVAPGRCNLIGEHTDYTGGFVMPFAIDYSTVIYGSGSLKEGTTHLYNQVCKCYST